MYVKYFWVVENLGFVDMVFMDKMGIFMENKLVFYLMYFGECFVIVYEIVFVRDVEGFDVFSFEVLFKVWVFMLEIGDCVKENKDIVDIVVVYVFVEELELGEFLGEEVVDEIYLDVVVLVSVVEFGWIDDSGLF